MILRFRKAPAFTDSVDPIPSEELSEDEPKSVRLSHRWFRGVLREADATNVS